jgi:hypothetical protein
MSSQRASTQNTAACCGGLAALGQVSGPQAGALHPALQPRSQTQQSGPRPLTPSQARYHFMCYGATSERDLGVSV